VIQTRVFNRGEPSEYGRVRDERAAYGEFSGDMTDELESYGRGSFIESFMSELLCVHRSYRKVTDTRFVKLKE